MSRIKLQLVDVDSGFCRVNYKVEISDGEYIYYCLQEDSQDQLTFYRCTD